MKTWSSLSMKNLGISFSFGFWIFGYTQELVLHLLTGITLGGALETI